jgi:mono/diheme cytochrome c family protein
VRPPPNAKAGAQLATFYNVNELGLGRVVECIRENFNPDIVGWPTNTVCTVGEYAPTDSSGKPVFGSQASALALADAGAHPISTSFIVSQGPSQAYGQTAPPFPITSFASFDATGAITASTAFDSVGYNSVVPNNCLACHGGTSSVYPGYPGDGANSADTSAFLLPLDPGAMAFGTHTYAQQAEAIRQINAMILAAAPSPAIADFINGSYHGAVNNPGAAFDTTYVPAGWSTTSTQTKVYNQVIKPYCRGCHQSQVAANGGVDFLNATDADALRALIVSDVCVAHRMPHAQQPMLRFWGSGARAQLLGFFGRKDFAGQACTP